MYLQKAEVAQPGLNFGEPIVSQKVRQTHNLIQNGVRKPGIRNLEIVGSNLTLGTTLNIVRILTYSTFQNHHLLRN